MGILIIPDDGSRDIDVPVIELGRASLKHKDRVILSVHGTENECMAGAEVVNKINLPFRVPRFGETTHNKRVMHQHERQRSNRERTVDSQHYTRRRTRLPFSPHHR